MRLLISGGPLAVMNMATNEDTEKTVTTFCAWKQNEDTPGFCKSATSDQIADQGYVLTPNRYVGAENVKADGNPFSKKMATLNSKLADQFAESTKLEKAAGMNMKALGFELPVGGQK